MICAGIARHIASSSERRQVARGGLTRSRARSSACRSCVERRRVPGGELAGDAVDEAIEGGRHGRGELGAECRRAWLDAVQYELLRPSPAQPRCAQQVAQAEVVYGRVSAERARELIAREPNQCARLGADVDRIDDDRASGVDQMRQQQQPGGTALDERGLGL